MPVKRTVVLTREMTDEDKITPQGKLIVQLLGKGPLERSKLVSLVEKKLEGKTVQDASTIVAFQLGELKKAGLARVDVEYLEKPASKPAKKKAAKDAAKEGESEAA